MFLFFCNCDNCLYNLPLCYFSFNMLSLNLLIFFFFYSISYSSGPIFYSLLCKADVWCVLCIGKRGGKWCTVLVHWVNMNILCTWLPLQLCSKWCREMINPYFYERNKKLRVLSSCVDTTHIINPLNCKSSMDTNN